MTERPKQKKRLHLNCLEQLYKMNYKNESIRQLQQFVKDIQDYSLGEIIYSATRLTGAKTIIDIKNLSDEDFYTAIEKASQLEKE